jgi:hypothetical protein
MSKRHLCSRQPPARYSPTVCHHVIHWRRICVEAPACAPIFSCGSSWLPRTTIVAMTFRTFVQFLYPLLWLSDQALRRSQPRDSGVLDDAAVDLLLVELINLAFVVISRYWSRNKRPVEEDLHNTVTWDGIGEDEHQLRVLSADEADGALLDDPSFTLTKRNTLQIGKPLSTAVIGGTAALWAATAYFVRKLIDSLLTRYQSPFSYRSVSRQRG